ncbi:MAG: hypothetical protein O8C60_02940 [Candidatus Methanoperedens sp.]|nr:hypothetical protein [Candidatus Methanoperedens sp.]
MRLKKIIICFLTLLLVIYPASASEASLNRWVLNVTLHDDGLVDEVIQAEFENTGSLPLAGFSFVIPASKITVIRDFYHTSDSTGEVEQQTVEGGLKVIINFNNPVEPGKKWNGRVGFTAENWVVKKDSNYSIDIPVSTPQVIISGKSTDVSVAADADIRSQVFLPESIEVISVTPKPFRILFQNDRMVPTWSSDKLHIGDTISIKSSYSIVLNKIVETDKKWRELKARIDEAEVGGIDVSEAKAHLKSVEDYNTNQALQSYWKNDYNSALEFNGFANDELRLAEDSLSSGNVKVTPEAVGSKKNPGFESSAMVLMLLITLIVKRKKSSF